MKRIAIYASLALLLICGLAWGRGMGPITGAGGIPFPGQGQRTSAVAIIPCGVSGSNAEGASAGISENYALGSPFTASSDCTINTLYGFIQVSAGNSTENFQLGLYSNKVTSGEARPDTLLASTGSIALDGGAGTRWYKGTIANTSVVSGTTYWCILAVTAASGTDAIQNRYGSSTAGKGRYQAGTVLPASWGLVDTSNNRVYSLYGIYE